MKRFNFGKGRYLSYGRGVAKVHYSVREMIKGKKGSYIPAVRNWKMLRREGMIEWVN